MVQDEISKNFESCLIDSIVIYGKYKLHDYGYHGDSRTIAIVEIAKFLYYERYVYNQGERSDGER
jgi:hypothetical protein